MTNHEPLHAVFTARTRPAADDNSRSFAFLLGLRDRKYGRTRRESLTPWLSKVASEHVEAYDAGYEAKGDKAA